jgi:LDH2 family malate/lactate/ureidoglycolate dehydrogenase
MSKIALQLSAEDSVASVLAKVSAGDTVQVQRPDGGSYQITAADDIPFGHKVAVGSIDAGSVILKYGVPIGRATRKAGVGDHIHVHNVAGFVGPSASAHSTQASAAEGSVVYDATRLRAWVEDIGLEFGVSKEAAADLAEAIIDAELCGVSTHGLRRLLPYMKRVSTGTIDGQAEPQLTGGGPIIEVDGRNGIGAHVLRVASDAALKRAGSDGIGLALVRNSNHAGAIGWAADRIARRGMVGIVISNGPALIAPPGGTIPFVSNSPIAISAPLPDGDTFLVDMATSMVSRDRIRQAAEAGTPIPAGWALDSAGVPTQDAVAAMAGALLPIGGPARGFALILGLEVLSGLLPNALTDVLVPLKESSAAPEGIGHFILVIDPAHLSSGDSLPQRLAQMSRRLEELPSLPAGSTARLPGHRRGEQRKATLQNGIVVSEITLKMLVELADQTGHSLPAENGSVHQ